jgi:FixJ family two-component response regulator
MSSNTQTVFIVDDAPEVRLGLSRVLAAAGYQVLAFESARRFLDEQDESVPGCLLLDVWMPDLSGLDLQCALVSSPCARPVVFMTGLGDIKTSVQAMKAGAIDFLTKPIDSARLIEAVERAFQCDAERRLQRLLRTTIQQRVESLTLREREVLSHVIRGRINKLIAGDMGVGEKTVKVFRARVMSKMGVRSVPELVQLAARVGVAIEPALSDRASRLTWRQTMDPEILLGRERLESSGNYGLHPAVAAPL